MMKRSLALVLSLLLTCWPTTLGWAQSGGNCSVYRSWITGDSLTAGDLNSSFTSAAVTNDTQVCTDGISDTVAGMRTSTNPFGSNTESLATSGAGELERLRYTIANALGWAYWYSNDTNVRFDHAAGLSNIQGAGTGRHVTAVGYHSWAGSARFPAIAGRYVHTTGLFWPAAHHLAISIDPAVDRDRAGVETFRFHAQALTLHHTAALRFMHSQAFAANWQYPHITALQVRAPQRGPDGAQPDMADISDQIILGHRGVALQLQGASLTPTANRLIGWGPSGDYIEGKAISGSLTITHQAGQIVFGAAASTSALPYGSVGQFSGSGRQANADDVFTLSAHAVVFMNAADHTTSRVWNPSAISVNITTSGPAAAGRDRATALGASSWVHFYWIYDGTTVSGIASPNTPVVGGPNLTGLTHDRWSYAGAVRLNASEDLVPTHIWGATAYYHQAIRLLSAGSATSETIVDAEAQVPPNALAYWLSLLQDAGGATSALTIRYLSGNNYFVKQAANVDVFTQVRVPNYSQRFYYFIAVDPVLAIEIMGYELPNKGI